MKPTGKGTPFVINNGGTSQVNAWKQELSRTPPAPVRDFAPLKVQPHPRSAEMQAYAAIPSWQSQAKEKGD